jgi:hypothetical protein
MTDEARAVCALLASICGWFAVYGITCHNPHVMKAKLNLAAAAGVGALLPFVPDLVKLVPLPSAVANAVCALVVAVAYALVPKKDPAK